MKPGKTGMGVPEWNEATLSVWVGYWLSRKDKSTGKPTFSYAYVDAATSVAGAKMGKDGKKRAKAIREQF
jgi:hypothetical protein